MPNTIINDPILWAVLAGAALALCGLVMAIAALMSIHALNRRLLNALTGQREWEEMQITPSAPDAGASADGQGFRPAPPSAPAPSDQHAEPVHFPDFRGSPSQLYPLSISRERKAELEAWRANRKAQRAASAEEA